MLFTYSTIYAIIYCNDIIQGLNKGGLNMDATKEYKVFISYSWTTPEHEAWINELASRLTIDGIEVKYDKWDLKPGQDKYSFMESMVTDESINRVLIICDKGYKEKADNRAGGVGTETQIITPEIYDKVNQEKFIPIIAERGEKFDSYMPIFLKSRIGIDLSSEENYENGYEQLLRLIAERPLYRRPFKGKLPSFLFEDEKSHFKTSNIIKQLKNFLITKPDRANYLIADFIEEFKNSLEQFQIEDKDFKAPYDEQIYSNINDMFPLRDDYIEFLSSICRSKVNFDIDIIVTLFEDLYPYTTFQGSGTYNELQFDHYKFFITELFLYTVIILIDNNLYQELNVLLSTKYFIRSNYEHENEITFNSFRFYISSLDSSRKSRLNLNRVSITADLLIQRSIVNNKNYKEKLIEADLLLYYLSIIKSNGDMYDRWFPTTYIYNGYRKVDMLKRLASERHFIKVKALFNVNTKEEMRALFENCKVSYRGYNSSFESIPNICYHIKPEDICTYA